MTFETKYNNDETIWFISSSGKLIEATISTVKAYQFGGQRVNKGKIFIEYEIKFFNGSTILEEERLYPNKEEAANAWLKSQGLSVGLKE